jgi:LysM repeat protein
VVEPSSGALSAEAIARQVAAERASAPVAAVPEAAAAEVAEAVTTMPVMITEITAPYERLDNTKLSYETVASDVKIVGEFTNQTLSPAERAEVSEYLKQNAQRLMYAHANISESKLEAELFEKLQGKYGTSSWWGEAKVSAVDIGGLVVRPIAAAAEAVASAATQAPIEIMEESVAGGARVTLGDSSYTEAASRTSDIYTVQKGDTLYGIAEKQFAAELKHLSPIERGQILDSLFDKVDQYPELKDSLGLRSGNIDVISPDEKLNLSGLEAELEVLLERREIIEQFKNSAPLPVEADNEVKNVPITIVEKPVLGGTAVTVEGGTYTEAKPVVTESASNVSKQPEVIPPPRPFALNGQYADQPAYKEYIQQVFGSAKAYEQAVERAVQNFDNTTYDVFDRSSIFGGGTYESPYRLLSDMSLQEVTEFEQQPNAEIRAFLNENNIKYDTYLAWLDKIDEMVQVLPNEAETKVSDLFSRYVVEFEKPKGNSLIK